jgi:preprotein translocase subunit SecY
MFATKLLTRINNFAHKYKTLLQQLLFTLFILIVFRIGAYLTIPGIKLSNLGEASTKLGFFDLLSILGGGALTRFSIFALGVSPYITASIITQLLSTDVIPVLSK